jgi:hypothetical protein
MTPTEIRDVLGAIEDALPVATWHVDGVPVWPVFRIWFVFNNDEFAQRAASRPTSMLANIGRAAGRYANAAIRDFAHREHNATGDVVFFTHTTCRVFQVDGRWYDQFCEPIAELLDQRGHRSVFLEHAPRNEYRIPRSRSSELVQPALSAIAIASGLAASSRVLPGEPELAAYFAKHHPDLRIDFAAVRKRVLAVRPYTRYFANKLARIRPKLAFVVNYYDLPAMAFVLACRELGIPSVDIQHGVQGDLHLAYSHWRNVPPTGYALLPTMFWCWTAADAATIREWSAPVERWHRPLVAGNLVLAKFMHDDDALVRIFDRDVEAKLGAVNVLITLRPRGGLPPLMRAAIEAAPPSWTWWIRLHPAMLDERPAIEAAAATLGGRRVVIDEATRLPLYALLRHMNVHVTEISSTVLEADQFGVPSVLCHPTGVEYYAPLVRVAVGAFTAHEIVAAIDAQLAMTLPRKAQPAIDAATLAELVEAPR